MEGMERLIIILDENDNKKIAKVCRVSKDGTVQSDAYYPGVHDKEIADFIESKGIAPNEFYNSKDKGFEIYVEGSEEAKEIEAKEAGAQKAVDGFVFPFNIENEDSKSEENDEALDNDQTSEGAAVPVEDDSKEESDADEEEISDEDLEDAEEDDKGIAKGVIAGVTAAALLAGGGIAYKVIKDHQKNKNQEKTDDKSNTESSVFDTDASFDELMNSLSKDSTKRVFFENVYDVLQRLNKRCANTSVFALAKDDGEKLVFTSDEVIAAALALNDFDADQLYEIFGDYTLDAEELFANYMSFASKLEIYAMNATKVSGVSKLIENENSRQVFEDIEKSIIDFNNSNSLEKSDLINRYVAYYCAHGINGVDAVKDNKKYSSLNSARNLAIHMATGFYDANVNGEYSKYLKVSTAPTAFDNNFIKNRESQVQKGEKLEYYLNLAGKSFCNQDYVQKQLASVVSALEKAQATNISSVENIARQEIGKALFDAGKTELANEVLQGPISRENLDLALKAGVDSNLILRYTEAKTLTSKTVSFEEIKAVIDAELGPYNCGDITILYNNRIKGSELVNSKGDGKYISKEEWNSMSPSEQLDYAKQHGTLVSSTTSTSTQRVGKDDLTPSERTQAEEQESRVSQETHEVEIGDGNGENTQTYTGNAADAAIRAAQDANVYANESGAYSHSAVYDRTNPNYPVKVDTSTLLKAAQAAYAFNNETITINDSQIQKRMASDVAKYSQTTYDSSVVEAYKKAWINTMKNILAGAKTQGLDLRNESQQQYEAALRAAEERNRQEENRETTTRQHTTEEPTTEKENTSRQQTTEAPQTTTRESQTTTTEEYDPNVNPVIADSDEEYNRTYYDENIDGYNLENSSYNTNSYSNEEYYEYIADSVLDEGGKVLVKTMD